MMLRSISASLLLCALSAQSAGLALKAADKEPPKEIGEAIRNQLQPKSIQLLEGDKPALELWLVEELPTQGKAESPSKTLDVLKQPVVLGAVSVTKPRRDYRGDEIPAGVYTLRFALQPQDGNHSGSAEFAYFGVLVPAKLDPTPEGIADYKALMSASSKETSTDHPRVLSLRPASSPDGELPKLNEPAPEHKSLRVKVPAKGGDAVVFEIVYEGKGHT